MNTQPLQIAHLAVQWQAHPQVWSPLSAVEMMSFLVTHDYLKDLDQRSVLDFGTGSGVVGIVCGLLGAAPLILSDYSEVAATVAKQNALLNGLSQVQSVQSDRFAQIPNHSYDLIISNPPVQPWLFTDLAHPDARGKVAAWNEAGADGRLVLDALLKQAKAFLAPGGRLITSSSSRHGHRQTVKLWEQYWSGRWEQIYAIEHAILPDYHGPYLPIWKHLQALDGDLRIYQIDDRNRRFAQQLDATGQPITITELELDGRPQAVILRQNPTGEWRVSTPDGMPLCQIAADDPRLPGPPSSDRWYYQYYLFQGLAEPSSVKLSAPNFTEARQGRESIS